MHKFVASALFVLAVSACVDAKKKFDEFDDRAGRTDASTIDATGGGLFDVTGHFLLSAHPSAVTPDPNTVVRLRGDWVLDQSGAQPMISATVRFLNAQTGELVPPGRGGTPVTVAPAPVAQDGTFVVSITGTLPGEANPISGTPGPMDARLGGTIRSADLFCGSVDGTVLINVDGSTFAAQRMAPDATPAMFPPMLSKCPVDQPVDAGVDAPVDAPTDAPPDA